MYSALCIGQTSTPLHVEPLTGMTIVSSGMEHAGVEARINSPYDQMLLSQALPMDAALELHLKKPKGFKLENNLAYFGVSIKVTSLLTGKPLANLNDVYGADAQGYIPQNLNELTARIDFSRGSYGSKGERIMVEVVFFDKKSSGKITVKLPSLMLVDELPEATFTHTVKQPGYIVASNRATSTTGMICKDIGAGPVNSLKLKTGEPLYFTVSSDELQEESAVAIARWMHWDGELIAENSVEIVRGQGQNWVVEAPKTTAALKGLYLLTGSISSEDASSTVGFNAWVVCGSLESDLAKQLVAGQFTELSRFYRTIGNKELSHQMQAAALNTYKFSAENLYKEGSFYMKDGNTDQGITYFEQALLIDSLFFDAHLALGKAYKSQRNYDEALEHLMVCAELQPTNYDALFYIGWLYNERGRYNQALEYLDKAKRHNTQMDASIYYERAFANRKLQNYKSAVLDYEKFTALRPNEFKGYYYKGFTYLDLKEYDRSVDALQRAVRLDDQSYDAYYELGYALQKLKRYDESINAYDAALELGGTTELAGNILLRKAECLIDMGSVEEACATLDRAIGKGKINASKIKEKNCK